MIEARRNFNSEFAKEVSGEIEKRTQKKAEEPFEKRPKSLRIVKEDEYNALDAVGKKSMEVKTLLGAYIGARLDKRTGFSSTEARSILHTDLMPMIGDKKIKDQSSLDQIKEKIGKEPYLATDETIEMKIDSGETAKFEIIIKPDGQYDLMDAPGDELATKLMHNV